MSNFEFEDEVFGPLADLEDPYELAVWDAEYTNYFATLKAKTENSATNMSTEINNPHITMNGDGSNRYLNAKKADLAYGYKRLADVHDEIFPKVQAKLLLRDQQKRQTLQTTVFRHGLPSPSASVSPTLDPLSMDDSATRALAKHLSPKNLAERFLAPFLHDQEQPLPFRAIFQECCVQVEGFSEVDHETAVEYLREALKYKPVGYKIVHLEFHNLYAAVLDSDEGKRQILAESHIKIAPSGPVDMDETDEEDWKGGGLSKLFKADARRKERPRMERVEQETGAKHIRGSHGRYKRDAHELGERARAERSSRLDQRNDFMREQLRTRDRSVSPGGMDAAMGLMMMSNSV